MKSYLAKKNGIEILCVATTHTISITGKMCPEELFLPVHDWLEEYFETYENTQLLLIKVKSPCMAITSSVCFRNLLEICEEANLKGKAIQLNWYINEGINDREIKCIEHFQETVTFPFQLIKY